ncbi:hypothetical protein HGRIS_007160 [Hohenbuehelia grisea]|uniref:F-box domain-containing protein n=1 Tax=Hohenbuehelia grisea TaxID=104357 RepID=A0ABR3JBS8_9AGAR
MEPTPPTINNLAPELLAEIFLLCVPHPRPQDVSVFRDNVPLVTVALQGDRAPWTLRGVNTKWKKIVDESSKLWSYIRISGTDLLSLSMLKLQLELSRSRPLTVEFDGSLKPVIAHVHEVYKHAGRWAGVTIFPRADTLGILNRHAPPKFPVMEHLEIVYETNVTVGIPRSLFSAPRLRLLSLSLLQNFRHDLPVSLDVEEVRLHMTEKSISSVLRIFPVIAATVVALFIKNHTPDDALAIPIDNFTPITFPRLRTFHLKGCGFDALIEDKMILPAVEDIVFSTFRRTTVKALARLLSNSNTLLRSLTFVVPRGPCSDYGSECGERSRLLSQELRVLFSTCPQALQLNLRACQHVIHAILRDVDLPAALRGLRLQYRRDGFCSSPVMPEALVIPAYTIVKLHNVLFRALSLAQILITVDDLKPSEQMFLAKTLGNGIAVSPDDVGDSISPWNDYHEFDRQRWYGRWIRWT